MIRLNKYQAATLRRLANSRVKNYCVPAGLGNEEFGAKITEDFNDILRLVEVGLLIDISNEPEHRGKCRELMALEGRDIVIVRLSLRGQQMFERTAWEKWVN